MAGELSHPEARATCAVIAKLAAKRGHAPSLEELGAELGLTRRGAHYRLTILARRGLVTWRPNIPRTLVLTDAGRAELALPSTLTASRKKD